MKKKGDRTNFADISTFLHCEQLIPVRVTVCIDLSQSRVVLSRIDGNCKNYGNGVSEQITSCRSYGEGRGMIYRPYGSYRLELSRQDLFKDDRLFLLPVLDTCPPTAARRRERRRADERAKGLKNLRKKASFNFFPYQTVWFLHLRIVFQSFLHRSITSSPTPIDWTYWRLFCFDKNQSTSDGRRFVDQRCR